MPWLIALALVVAALVGFEHFVRTRGYAPSVKDDHELWAAERSRIGSSPRTLVVLGASRIQLAWATAAARTRLPGWTLVNLAIDGSSPVGTLRDLAADPDFRGVALVDANEDQLVPTNWDSQDAWIAAYHHRWSAPDQVFERWLETRVQSHLALAAASGGRSFGYLLQHGAWPPPPYVTTFADRSRYADFSRADVARIRAARIAKLHRYAPDPASWLRGVRGVESFVREIQARGGVVVFVRMPTCGPRWEMDQANMPKAKFWDRFAQTTSAITVHFADYASLSAFSCPDTSHIDSRDAARFTGALLDVLAGRGVLGDR